MKDNELLEIISGKNIVINEQLSFREQMVISMLEKLRNNICLSEEENKFLLEDKDNLNKEIDIPSSFFEMVRGKHYTNLEIYDLFSKSNVLVRSGWINSKVPFNHLETTAEHMFNMFIMGLMYLPDELDDKEYDKNRILKMVMLHDLAETVTGDIPHPKKTEIDEIKEDLVAKALFLSLVYNNAPSSIDTFNLWCEWTDEETINSKIAHDLDVLQLNYQFMTYACKSPETFDDFKVDLWTRRRPKTEIGLKLYQELIIDNPVFKERRHAIHGE